MTASEWLGVMKQAQDFPRGMEKLIVKYGEMLIAEHESKVKKLTIADVSSSVTRTIRTQQGFSQHELTLPEDDAIMYMLILKRNKIWFADVTR